MQHVSHSSLFYSDLISSAGPGGAKNSNVTVQLSSFEATLKRVLAAGSRSSSSSGSSSSNGGEGDVTQSTPASCDGDGSWCLGANEQSLFASDTHDERGPVSVDPELYQVDLPLSSAAGNETQMNSAFLQLERPFIRASIVTISISQTLHPHSTPEDPVWMQTLALQADITSRLEAMDQVFGYFPHLTVCSYVWSLPEKYIEGPFCIRADSLNFLSTIKFVDLTQEELVVHLWYQVSEKGGKVKGSDCYVPLNLNLPNSGLIFPAMRGSRPETSIECAVHVEGGQRTLLFAYTPTYRTSLQHATADFCRGYAFTDTECYQAVHEISQCVHARATDAELPNIQISPTPQDPFVFLHFEKVGGTSLRE